MIIECMTKERRRCFIHVQDQGGCSTRVNVVGMDWRIRLVFLHHVQWSFFLSRTSCMAISTRVPQKKRRNARQLVQKELAIMKYEISTLRIRSGSTVCIEASTGVGLGSGTFARPPPLSSRWNGTPHSKKRWNSKLGSQITPRVPFKESLMMK